MKTTDPLILLKGNPSNRKVYTYRKMMLRAGQMALTLWLLGVLGACIIDASIA